MQCRQCGTEIADKAIICYRCGLATTDPVRQAAPLKPRRSVVPSLVAALVLLALAYAARQASGTAADPGLWQAVASVLAGTALVVVVLGLIRRRR